MTFKGVSQLPLVNETITSETYQDNIKSDVLYCILFLLVTSIPRL